MLGFININKPSGVTSNYIVGSIKRKLKIKKVGHFGTLDPLANGVLPIAVGKATKLFDYFLNKQKVYIATFQFGYLTDTLDSEGKITQSTENIPNKKQIEEVLTKFKGKMLQIPPNYSAKNINGVRAYTLARMGKEIELNPKEIEIFEIKILEQIDKDTFKFYIHCSSGTYIRSIARDLGQSLNSLATMIALTRQKAGFFELDDAISIDTENINDYIIPIEKVLYELPKIKVEDVFYQKLLNGVSIPYNDEIEECLVYCKNELFGVGRIENNILKINILLKEITQ